MRLVYTLEVVSDYRCSVCEHWLAVYLINDKCITIGRIIDGRIDSLRMLFKNKSGASRSA